MSQLIPFAHSSTVIILGITILQDAEGRYNLNMLHQASGAEESKKPGNWVKRKSTQELAAELNIQVSKMTLDVVHGGERAGTYAHELLAVSYAGWISPAFQLRVNQAFIDSRTGATALPVVHDPTTQALIQLLVEHDAMKHELASVQRQASETDAKVDALIARQPPQGKMTPIDWLRRYSKPHLPSSVMDVFKYECRSLEEPEMVQPAGARFPWPYYGMYTLATAYDTATKQLSFIQEARDERAYAPRKRRQR